MLFLLIIPLSLTQNLMRDTGGQMALLKYSKGSLAMHRINVIPSLQGFIRFYLTSCQLWGKTFLTCPNGCAQMGITTGRKSFGARATTLQLCKTQKNRE